MKKCSKCMKLKDLSDFSSNGNTYYKSQCKKCNAKTTLNQRRRNKKTFLKNCYLKMRARNKVAFTKDWFVQWALKNKDFHKNFDMWTNSNFDLQQCPSIDRIDNSKPYEKNNIQFIPFWLNSKKDRIKEYIFLSPKNEIVICHGLRQICRHYNLQESLMSKVHSGVRLQHKGWKKYNDTTK